MICFVDASDIIRDVIPIPYSSGYKWKFVRISPCLVFHKCTAVWTTGLPLGWTKIVLDWQRKVPPYGFVQNVESWYFATSWQHVPFQFPYESWCASLPIIIVVCRAALLWIFQLFVWVLVYTGPKWLSNTLELVLLEIHKLPLWFPLNKIQVREICV